MGSPPKACTPAWTAREGGVPCGPQGRDRHVRGRSPGRVRARADAPASLLRPVQIGWSPQHSLRGGRATYFDPYQIESSRFFIALHEHCGHALSPFLDVVPHSEMCCKFSAGHIFTILEDVLAQRVGGDAREHHPLFGSHGQAGPASRASKAHPSREFPTFHPIFHTHGSGQQHWHNSCALGCGRCAVLMGALHPPSHCMPPRARAARRPQIAHLQPLSPIRIRTHFRCMNTHA